MSTVEFQGVSAIRPILHQPAPAVAKIRTQPSEICDVVIIGSGPYGLSVAAELAVRGASFRIFGKPLETWREHMPKDMMLKSEGFASCLSHPSKDSTLKAYCAARGIPYSDQTLPVSLDLFVEYADWFQKTYVPTLEQKYAANLETIPEGFKVTLDDGEIVKARRVVLAVGVTWFCAIPEVLNTLSPSAASHSYAHRDVSRFRGKDVVVWGSGASAIDVAAMLNDEGARVKIVARDHTIRFHAPPGSDQDTFCNQLKSP